MADWMICGMGWAQSPCRASRRCCRSALVVAAIFSLLSRGAEAVLTKRRSTSAVLRCAAEKPFWPKMKARA